MGKFFSKNRHWNWKRFAGTIKTCKVQGSGLNIFTKFGNLPEVISTKLKMIFISIMYAIFCLALLFEVNNVYGWVEII